ncbi:hypothetical protein HRbin39_00886 [bacterium HR39]|nr:hypothetical protein HRbin39_00886 [bacterium HR39]
MRGPVRSVLPLLALAGALLPPDPAEAGRRARFREHATLTVRVVVVAPCDPTRPDCIAPSAAERPRVREETTPEGVRLRTVDY